MYSLNELMEDDKKLCEWLRANSSGAYRATALAADRIDILLMQIEQLKFHIKGLQEAE